MEYKEAVELWFENYELKTKLKPKWGQKEGKLLKELLKLCSTNKVSDDDFECLIIWFMDQDEGFIPETKWDFGYFYSGFNKHLIEYRESIQKTHRNAHREAKRVQDGQRPIMSFNELQSRFSGKKRDLNQLAQSIINNCYTLKEAVRVMKVYSHDQTRKDHAQACIINWGKEAYIKEYNRQYLADPKKIEILKDQAKKIQENPENEYNSF